MGDIVAVNIRLIITITCDAMDNHSIRARAVSRAKVILGRAS